jgi:predicted PolB exonuclease-like 3'-5' exonuclease
VTFNGRTFDVPLLELAAFRYGISMPGWYDTAGGRPYQQPRNRFNTASHLDLLDLLTNFGASRFAGGLNLTANLLGKPGKMDIEGHMVQDLYNDGQLARINDYCRCDVLDTYFVFLRTRVLTGRMSIEREQEMVAQTKQWLQEKAEWVPAYQLYLEKWGDWPNPWREEAEQTDAHVEAEGGTADEQVGESAGGDPAEP